MHLISKKKRSIAAFILPIIIVAASCSKSNNEVTPEKPVAPPTTSTDSTKKDSNTISLAKRDTIIYQNVAVEEFPILRKSFGDSIAIGMYVTNTNSLLTPYPNVNILDNAFWSTETYFTEAIGDSFSYDAIPNKKNQNAFIQNFLKYDHSFQQWVGSSVGTRAELNGRFNNLRATLGTKDDVKELFGLDKSDTSSLDSNYTRMYYTMEATKFNVTLENNPYGPDNYSTIKNGSSDWTKYFGQDNPYFINTISYGYGVTMIFESKDSTKLQSALSHLFSQTSASLKEGTALASLSTEDQTVLNATKYYGFKLGIGTVSSHKVSDGIMDAYQYITAVTDDNSFIGYPIRYTLNGYKKSDPTLKVDFSLAYYTTYQPTGSK